MNGLVGLVSLDSTNFYIVDEVYLNSFCVDKTDGMPKRHDSYTEDLNSERKYQT